MIILIVEIESWVYTYVKVYKFYILNIYSFIICHLYFDKAILKNFSQEFAEW